MLDIKLSLYLYTLAQLLLISLASHPHSNIIPVKDPDNIILTFGSCNSFYGDEPNDIFLRVSELNPDVWVWLGDVAYVDLDKFPFRFGYMGEEITRQRFIAAKNNPIYTQLRESTTVIGVWDDHDYGKNNGGKSFPYKDVMKELWLDFIDEPKDSTRRKRKGIYESYCLGNVTKVKVILLDVRYFKDEPGFFSWGGRDVLGDEQWEWLENELKENQAEYVVIGSGIQIISDDRLLPETWYKESRDRLIDLIKKYKIGGVILISGDVHYTEIMKYPCKERVGFELYEFTSSGITHYQSSHVPLVDKVVAKLYPDTWNSREDKYFERNFGAIRFKFGEEKSAKLEARNFYGKLVLEKDLPYSQLEFNQNILSNQTYCVVDTSRYYRFWSHYFRSILSGELYVYLFTVVYVCLYAFFGLLIGLSFPIPFKVLSWIRRKIKQTLKPKLE